MLTEELHTCPKCQGKGEITIKVNGEDDFDMMCLHCDGEGKLTEGQIQEIKRQDNMLCHCGNGSGQATYHPDTAQMKHYWTCNECNKITQIG